MSAIADRAERIGYTHMYLQSERNIPLLKRKSCQWKNYYQPVLDNPESKLRCRKLDVSISTCFPFQKESWLLSKRKIWKLKLVNPKWINGMAISLRLRRAGTRIQCGYENISECHQQTQVMRQSVI